jgi:ribonucleoside-diphosphate reductase alpha chain
MNYTKMTTFLRKGYHIVKDTNTKLAKEAGVPPSIRVGTIKPSGSISLLAGVTPGVHYPVSRYAIRRMRIGKDSPLVPALAEAGIPYEDDQYSDNTLVFEFAVDHGNVRVHVKKLVHGNNSLWWLCYSGFMQITV